MEGQVRCPHPHRDVVLFFFFGGVFFFFLVFLFFFLGMFLTLPFGSIHGLPGLDVRWGGATASSSGGEPAGVEVQQGQCCEDQRSVQAPRPAGLLKNDPVQMKVRTSPSAAGKRITVAPRLVSAQGVLLRFAWSGLCRRAVEPRGSTGNGGALAAVLAGYGFPGPPVS